MLKIFIIPITFLLFFENSIFANDLDSCQILARKVFEENRKFPIDSIKNIRPIALWSASKCDKPPTGKGDIVQLCDAELPTDGAVIYWQKRTTKNIIRYGYNICK